MGALAAGEDTHRLWPAGQLVAGGSLPQQAGQLGDVGFLDPAGPVPAADVAAGSIGAALADLPAVIDRDLPRIGGDQPDRRLLPRVQLPPGRADDRAPAAGSE